MFEIELTMCEPSILRFCKCRVLGAECGYVMESLKGPRPGFKYYYYKSTESARPRAMTTL